MSPSLWVTVEKLSQQAVWLLLFIILAPILGPRPYGLFAIVMVFVGFCEFVTVEAAAEALIGMDLLEPAHLRTAMTCNLLVGVLAGIAVFLLAPLLAIAFQDAELVPLFRALAILPTLSALTSAPIALLKRQMEFRPMALRATLGLAIGGVVSVALALHGAGVWALIAQILVQRAAEAIILWLGAGRGAFAGFGFSRPHARVLGAYAGHVFVSRSAVFLGAQLPRVVVGYFLGPVDLGLFTLATRLPETLAQIVIAPKSIVARVDLRRYRIGEAALDRAFYRLLRDIAILAFPMSLGAAATIPLLFSVWLDERWQAGLEAAQLSFLTLPPQVVFYSASAVLMAFNFPKQEARIATLQSLSNALFVLAAVPFGLNAVCLVMAARFFLYLPYPTAIVARMCRIRPRIVVGATLPLFGVSLAVSGTVIALTPAVLGAIGPLLALPALAVGGAALYAGLVAVFMPDEVRRFIAHLPFVALFRTLPNASPAPTSEPARAE